MTQEPGNLTHLLCGSEGTLAAIISAELKIVPLPKQKGLAAFLQLGTEAMQATVELSDLKPAAIEHMDRVLLTKRKDNGNSRPPAICSISITGPANRFLRSNSLTM